MFLPTALSFVRNMLMLRKIYFLACRRLSATMEIDVEEQDAIYIDDVQQDAGDIDDAQPIGNTPVGDNDTP